MLELSLIPILLVAAFVHGIFGFGFPLLATPMLVLFFPLPTAILMTLIPTLAINLGTIAGEKHWREAIRHYWSIPITTVLGSLLGTQLLLSVDPEPFRAVLAAVLVAYLVTDRLRKEEHEPRFPLWSLPVMGFGLGILAGVANVFAPLLAVFALYTRMDHALMFATFNITFFFSKSGQVAGFIARDAFDPEVVSTTLWLIPPILLCLWLGIRIRRRFSVDQYRRLLKGFLWVLSVLLLVDWVAGGLIVSR